MANSANGRDLRWKNYLGVPKHLIPLGNTTLIKFIQEKLVQYGFTDINVICQESDAEKYLLNGSKRLAPVDTSSHLNPDHSFVVCRKFLSEDKPTLIFYGDNFYSKAFMDLLVSLDPNYWYYFGSDGASSHKGKPLGEVYAWYFHPSYIKLLTKATNLAAKDSYLKIGNEVKNKVLEYVTYVKAIELSNSGWENHMYILDETTDFDYPHEWDYWSKKFLPDSLY